MITRCFSSKKNSNFREFLLNEENWTIATKEDDNDDE